MPKKVKFNFMEYNHKIYELHYNNCQICQNDDALTYCIVCGQHLHQLDFCYGCGDNTCQDCCPIPLSSHNGIFEAKEEVN